MMSDILLVSLNADPHSGERLMPLGILYLQADLSRAGFSVEIRDIQLASTSKSMTGQEQMVQLMTSDAPVLGVSVMADRLPEAILALEQLRINAPDRIIVLGGPGPTIAGRKLMENFSFIDALVIGEGENTLRDIVDAALGYGRHNLPEIPGAIIRSRDNIYDGGPRTRIHDLDGLAYPAHSEAKLDGYDALSITTSRGCPFGCIFCSAGAIWGRACHHRSVDSVIEEICYLTSCKPGAYLHIEDDTFVLRPDWVRKFCKNLIATGITLEWGCTGRVGLVDEKLLKLMKQAGCRSMFIGVESGSERILRRIKKGFRPSEALKDVLQAASFFEVTAHAIWGYPFETLSECFETFLLMTYLNVKGINAKLSHYVPFPGSPLLETLSSSEKEPLPLSNFNFQRLLTVDPTSAKGQLILRYPEIFLPFYALDTPDREAKYTLARNYHKLMEPC